MAAINLRKYGLNDPPEDNECLTKWNRDVLIQILANTDDLKQEQKLQSGRLKTVENAQHDCVINVLNSWWRVTLIGVGFMSTVALLAFAVTRLLEHF